MGQPPAQCVWQDIVAPAAFDVSALERSFALATTLKSRVLKEDDSEKVKRHRVLDDRTSQRLAIAFRRLPPPERLAEIVDGLEGFPEALPAEAVVALSDATQQHHEAVEQIRQLQLTEADIGQLDQPERYLWALGRVTFCQAKLACGSLMLGSAGELPDLRKSGEKVGVCCQALRKSELLQKFVSTAIAVGNVMNRGTARSDAAAVVLPDALLKLDELRTAGGCQDCPADGRAETLLDFVAQAVVSASPQDQDSLSATMEKLISKTRAAQTVALEDVESSCRKISKETDSAMQSFKDVPESPEVSRISGKVRRIHEEAEFAMMLADNAKKELSKTLVWSCAKTMNVKSHEWFEAWSQLLEQISGAISRAKAPVVAEDVLQSGEASVAVLKDSNPGASYAHCRQGTTARRSSNCGVATNLVPGVKGGTYAAPEKPPAAQEQQMMPDDDARAESLDLAFLQQELGPSSLVGLDDKENSCR